MEDTNEVLPTQLEALPEGYHYFGEVPAVKHSRRVRPHHPGKVLKEVYGDCYFLEEATAICCG
jgi:hypothetical protein